MTKSFKQYLNKTKTRLDVSIQSADKWFSTGKVNNKLQELIESEITIEHKTDGVKLTVIKKSNTGNISDYVFAYKGNILYENEYNYQSNIDNTIGCSQFRKVFEHFRELKENIIPVNTELSIEFLMRKPTLSSNYTDLHKMVLIGYSETAFTETFGKLLTQPEEMQVQNRDQYAKELCIDVPQVLFFGSMQNEESFSAGILNKELMDLFETHRPTLNWDNYSELYEQLKQLFLAVNSKYGGLEEGVVLNYGRLLKWQQTYQNDQSKRADIKAQYREDEPCTETSYWNNVKETAVQLTESVHKQLPAANIDNILSELSKKLSDLVIEYTHSKKNNSIIKDDIQLNAKTLLLKKMQGNNNALIIGKFRVLTESGHVELIKKAQKEFDHVVICMVTSKETKHSQELRESLIKETFPNVDIIHSSNANIIRILQKSPKNINAIYAGSDRVKSYQEQVKNILGVQVLEMQRTDSDISASKIIEYICDKLFFMENTPEKIHKYYDLIKETYAIKQSE